MSDITQLRRMIDEPTESEYTDVDLERRLASAGGDLNAAAAGIWTEKAAAASTLVNISEGGSSRAMSQVAANAREMAALFGSRATVSSPVSPTLRRLSR